MLVNARVGSDAPDERDYGEEKKSAPEDDRPSGARSGPLLLRAR